MHTTLKRMVALLTVAVLLLTMVYIAPTASAASEFYGDYTDVGKVYDYGSCPGMQGLAVGSQYMYTIKINSNDTSAVISMTDKDTGSTTRLYNADAGSYYFNYMGHANDMDVWGIDGSSNLFVTTTNEGSNAIVRLKRTGNNLNKVASYRLTYNGVDTCATALAVKSVSNGVITFITKLGMDIYTGSVSTSATSATIPLTKICTISKSRVVIKGEILNLSNWVNQGFGYHDGTLFVPLSGPDDQLNRSVILVFNLEGASGTIYPTESLVFRVTSGAYSALFEIESCDICSSDGKLYFNSNRRITNSNTNHDGVSYFDGYTYSKPSNESTMQTYTIQYDANGGSGSMEDTTVAYGINTPLRKNTFIRNGYSFQGWTAYRTTQDQWYYTNGTDSDWYKEGSQPSGYTKYVYTDGVNVAKTSAVDKDVVIFYAQWKPLDKTYTIRYHANGGSGTMEDTTVVYGYNTPLRLNTFTRNGYTFQGWTAYRTTQDQWYYTNGTDSAWYKEGSQPAGYTKHIYRDGVNVAKTSAVDGDLVHFYAQWEQTCTHSYTSKVTTAAGCTTTGVKTFTCSICGDSYTESIAATGHSWNDATCTTPKTCANCGEMDGEALDHSYKSVTTAPTCTENGRTTYTCTGCGDSYIEIIAASGHKWNDATCITAKTCSVCGETEGKALGHNYEGVVRAPSCTKSGYTTYTCSGCGDSYIGNVTPATGHDWNNGACQDCGTVCDHVLVDGYCSVCGMKLAKDYYLFGYINGSDYACEGDADNIGEYRFVNGKLTATFTENSYVAVKTEDNANWYMTNGWLGEDVTSATLYSTTITGEYSNKLFVPGGVEVTFTLVENTDGTLTLSYVVAEPPVVEDSKDIKWQVTSGTNADSASTNLRLLTWVDTLEDYSSVSFNVTINGKTTKLECTTVYTAILASGVAIRNPANVFKNESANYFVTYTLKNIPSSSFDTPIVVTVTWTDLWGNETTSESKTIVISSDWA